MKHVGSITRTAHLFGFALLVAGCADHQPTSPDVGPKLGPAAVGSIIQSSVVTATTFCGPSGKCSTNTRYAEISEKVGRASGPQAMMGMLVGGGTTSNPQLPSAALKNLHVSGRTLYAESVGKDGKTWHVELTHDPVAKGKISGVRLFNSDGELLLAASAKWKDVSGVWYREHTDLTFYHEGRVGLHQEKSFTPRAVLAPDPSDRSAVTLTPRFEGAVCMEGGPDPCPTDGCPYSMPICDWLQAGNPLSGLANVINVLEGAVQSIANWFTALRSGSGSNDTAELAEVLITAAHSINEPSLVAIAEAVSVASSAAITETLTEYISGELSEFLIEVLVALM